MSEVKLSEEDLPEVELSEVELSDVELFEVELSEGVYLRSICPDIELSWGRVVVILIFGNKVPTENTNKHNTTDLFNFVSMMFP